MRAKSARREAPATVDSHITIRSFFTVCWDGHMAFAHRYDRSSDIASRFRARQRVFSLITLGLIASVVAGVAAAARSNKWWWDNLAGPDSSNFRDLDQITKAIVRDMLVPYMPHAAIPHVLNWTLAFNRGAASCR